MNAYRGALMGWNAGTGLPTENSDWDDYASRAARYTLSTLYYHNQSYSTINTYFNALKLQRGYYKHMRSIFNPTARLVNLYVAKCYGGSLDMEAATRGAITVNGADDALRQAIIQLWKWSNFGTEKSLYVRRGAMLGDSVIKIVDDTRKRKVRMELLHPEMLRYVEVDDVGNIKYAVIEYNVDEETPLKAGVPTRAAKTYRYREVITPDTFETFKNEEPFAYFEDGAGTGVSKWDNEYGFVPVVLVQHSNEGQTFGVNAYQTSLSKVDEINDAASLLNDQIRKTVNAIYYMAGVTKPDSLTASTDERDEVPMIYGPANTQPFAMVAPLQIADAMNNINSMLSELERDMPELSLHRLRESGQTSGVAAKITYSDAIDRIEEARGNYNDGLVRAQQMGVSIGGYRRYAGFESFDLSSYNAGDLQHTIGDRDIFPDALSTLERLSALAAIEGTEELRLLQLDVDQDSINAILLKQEANVRNAVSGFASSIFAPAEAVGDL